MFHVAVFTHFYCYERFQRMTILPTIANMKQIGCQIFLWQKWIYSGSEENCNLGSVTTMSHVQVSTRQGKENVFIERKRKLEGLQQTKSLAFHWLRACQERSPCWAALSLQGVRAPPSGLPTLLKIEVCVYYVSSVSRAVYFVGGHLDCFL